MYMQMEFLEHRGMPCVVIKQNEGVECCAGELLQKPKISNLGNPVKIIFYKFRKVLSIQRKSWEA